MPSSFPEVPVITKESNDLCCKMWNKIINMEVITDDGDNISGENAFYNEFYLILDVMDYNGHIDEVLLKNSLGEDKKTTKLDILMRVVKNIINIKDSSHETQKRLYMLGKMHSEKHIKPYFYSTFARTLIQSVYVLSKDDATEEAMDAWINQIAFVMKYMIVPLVESQIEETALLKEPTVGFKNIRIFNNTATTVKTKKIEDCESERSPVSTKPVNCVGLI
jgi:hemoglobin-like flavoprotein